ncbi:hypothetical protein OAJ56_01080 [Flavobacteriales bacterium]|nr:hypothetical protein [Flavobacteriales bacterium]
MKKLAILLGAFIAQVSIAQDYVHQVLVLNEGYFDYTTNQSIIPPTIGSYDPVTETYTTVDTILGARFASDMIIDGEYVYVAADNMLYKYDKDDMSLTCSQSVSGIRNLAVWNDKIIVTRGDYDNTTFMPILFNSYLQVFNTLDLSFYMELDTVSGPKWSTQNMITYGDNLYVAINNGFEWGNEKGLIGIVDMSSMTYLNEIDLGPDGKNPDNMVFDGTNIYTVNNKDFTGASISKLDISNGTIVTTNMSTINTGCGTSCLRDGKINYQISGDTELYEWDPVLMPSSGLSIGFLESFYDLATDEINNYLYASSTDWSTYGTINIYDSNNMSVGSFSCGISPGTIVFDVRSTTVGITNITSENILEGTIYDMFGRKLISLENQSEGIYLVDGEKVYIPKR